MKKYKLIAICSITMMICVVCIFIVHNTMHNHPDTQAITIPLNSVLASLFATCFVILIFDGILKPETNKELEELIQKSVDQSIGESLKMKVQGINSTYERFHNEEFIKSTRTSNNIYILQTYAPNFADIEHAIVELVNKNGEVQIALLDPDKDSSFVDIRALETNITHKTRDDFSHRIEESITRLKNMASKAELKGKITIGLYRRSPGVSIYATDNLMMVAPYLSHTDATSAPQIEIVKDSPLYNIYIDHFNAIWHGAKKVVI